MDLQQNLQGFFGLAEREVASPLATLARGIRSAIDIGAADGWYTTYFLTRTSAERVIAIEPAVHMTRVIADNVSRNKGDRSRLEIVGACIGASRPEQPNDDTLPLDTFRSVALPCLVKVDVEGAEAAVLASARALLQESDVRWLIEVHSIDLERECLDVFSQWGYRTRIIPNAWWRHILPETRPLPHNRWIAAWKEQTRSHESR